MRPRVFPAEDLGRVHVVHEDRHASMRPRVFPAEDRRDVLAQEQEQFQASMRPRVFPAEDFAEDDAVKGDMEMLQ